MRDQNIKMRIKFDQLRDFNIGISLSQIYMNYQEVFKCVICAKDYDQQTHQPMMICQNYHTICRLCLNAICQTDRASECPICRVKISRRNAIYIGSFFQYRDEALQIYLQKIKLQIEKKQLVRTLQTFQQKISYYGVVQEQYSKQNTQMKIHKKQIVDMQEKINEYADFEQKLQKYIDQIEDECRQLKKQIEKRQQQKINLDRKTVLLETALKKAGDQRAKLDQQIKIMACLQVEKQRLKIQSNQRLTELSSIKKINKDYQEKIKYYENECSNLRQLLSIKQQQLDRLLLRRQRRISNIKSQQQSLRLAKQMQRLKDDYQMNLVQKQEIIKQQAAKLQQFSRVKIVIDQENNQLRASLAETNTQQEEISQKIRLIQTQLQQANQKGEKLQEQNIGLKELNRTSIIQISYLKKRNNELIRLKNEHKKMIKQSQSTCNCKKHRQHKQQSIKQVNSISQMIDSVVNKKIESKNFID